MAIRTEYSHSVLQTFSTYKYEPHSVALDNSLNMRYRQNWQSFGQPDGFLKPKVTVMIDINIKR